MLPNTLLNRSLLRLVIYSFSAVAPIAIIYAAVYLILLYESEFSPLLAFVPQRLRFLAPYLNDSLFYCAYAESYFFALHSLNRYRIEMNDSKGGEEEISSEERWKIWRGMLESTKEPEDWLGPWFTIAGRQGRVELDGVGRDNIEEFITHAFYSRPEQLTPKEKEEIIALRRLLESHISSSRLSTSSIVAADTIPFTFHPGRSIHKLLVLKKQAIKSIHHPLIYYAFIRLSSEIMNTMLWLSGFKWISSAEHHGIFPLFFMRDSPVIPNKTRLSYWHRSSTSQSSPIVFHHGLSGTYGPTPFLLSLLYQLSSLKEEREIFIPEIPYLTMRLYKPAAILSRIEYVVGVREMLREYRNRGEREKEDSRRVVLLAHSLGSVAAAWLCRDAPELIQGTVLLDPMSILVFNADGPRNFMNTNGTTAGQIFFSFFAQEISISHYLYRHLSWTSALLFTTPSIAPLTSASISMIPTFSHSSTSPNYAPKLRAVPREVSEAEDDGAEGIRSRLFYSRLDCIIPVAKILASFPAGSAFEEGSLGSSETERKGGEKKTGTTRVLEVDHAACLSDWNVIGEVASAIKDVDK